MDYTPESLLQQLREQNFAPVYFLQGPEAYQLDRLSQYFTEQVLPKSARTFDLTIYYGRDRALEAVLSQARRLPMSGKRQVIVVREAQTMADLQRASSHELLLQYLQQPNPYTLLVFIYRDKTLDKRSKLYKTLQAKGVIVTTQVLYERQVPAWLESYVKDKGYALTSEAGQLLLAALGARLQVLANEVDKLFLHIPAGGTIDAALVEQFVGINREFNVFALQQALGRGDAGQALQIVRYMAANSKTNPIIPVITLLFNFFNKLLLLHQAGTRDKGRLAQLLKVNPFFVQDYLRASQRYSLSRVQACLQVLHKADCYVKGVDSPALSIEQTFIALVASLL